MSEGFVVTEIRYDDVASREVGHLCAFVKELGELGGVLVLFGGDFEDLWGGVSLGDFFFSYGIVFISHGRHGMHGSCIYVVSDFFSHR